MAAGMMEALWCARICPVRAASSTISTTTTTITTITITTTPIIITITTTPTASRPFQPVVTCPPHRKLRTRGLVNRSC